MPDPVLVMAVRRGRPEHSGEAEPVLFLREGNRLRLLLDDGEELDMDATEVQHATEGQAA